MIWSRFKLENPSFASSEKLMLTEEIFLDSVSQKKTYKHISFNQQSK